MRPFSQLVSLASLCHRPTKGFEAASENSVVWESFASFGLSVVESCIAKAAREEWGRSYRGRQTTKDLETIKLKS